MMTKSLIFKKSRSPSPTPELPSRGRCHHNRRLCLQIMIMRRWLCWLMISLIIINNLIKSCNIVSIIIITKPSVMNTTISNTVCFVPGRMTPPEICVSSAELSFYWQEGEIATTGKSNRWICLKDPPPTPPPPLHTDTYTSRLWHWLPRVLPYFIIISDTNGPRHHVCRHQHPHRRKVFNFWWHAKVKRNRGCVYPWANWLAKHPFFQSRIRASFCFCI